MNWTRDSTGRFKQRPYYIGKEIDNECENIISSFLQQSNKLFQPPISLENLEILLNQNVADLDLFTDISQYGTETEGLTEFQKGLKPIVKISELLSDERYRNRLKSTMAHEFYHVRFHDFLWQEKWNEQTENFLTGKSNDRICCNRNQIISAQKNDWMEWQASYGSGAITMPKSLLKNVIIKFRETETLTMSTLDPNEANGIKLINYISKVFEVSAEAAKVRMLQLGYLKEGGSNNYEMF